MIPFPSPGSAQRLIASAQPSRPKLGCLYTAMRSHPLRKVLLIRSANLGNDQGKIVRLHGRSDMHTGTSLAASRKEPRFEALSGSTEDENLRNRPPDTRLGRFIKLNVDLNELPTCSTHLTLSRTRGNLTQSITTSRPAPTSRPPVTNRRARCPPPFAQPIWRTKLCSLPLISHPDKVKSTAVRATSPDTCYYKTINLKSGSI